MGDHTWQKMHKLILVTLLWGILKPLLKHQNYLLYEDIHIRATTWSIFPNQKFKCDLPNRWKACPTTAMVIPQKNELHTSVLGQQVQFTAAWGASWNQQLLCVAPALTLQSDLGISETTGSCSDILWRKNTRHNESIESNTFSKRKKKRKKEKRVNKLTINSKISATKELL